MNEAGSEETTPAIGEMACPHCGAPLRASAEFCGRCGQPVAQAARQFKDFFISYTGDDVEWATWIAQKLEANGYRTIFQRRDFFEGGN